MTRVGDGGEFGENARIPGADFTKLDVSNGLETPIETRPLGVGERRGEFLELGGVQEEEMSVETINSHTMFTVGRVGDRNVVKNSKAGAGGFELNFNDLKKIGDFQLFKIKCTGHRHQDDRSEDGRGLCGGDVRGEGGTGEALFE